MLCLLKETLLNTNKNINKKKGNRTPGSPLLILIVLADPVNVVIKDIKK